jgi:hypothetical protein
MNATRLISLITGPTLFLVACTNNSKSHTPPPPGDVAYRGAVTGAGGESGVVDITLKALGSNAVTTADGSASATMYLQSGTVDLTGTYHAGQLDVSATAYQLTGPIDTAQILGTFTGPSGSGSFATLADTQQAVVVYCGSETFQGSSVGSWNLVQNANTLTGSYTASAFGQSGTLTGSLSGSSVSVTFDSAAVGSGTAQGTVSGTTVSGTWQVGSAAGGLGGTWSGDSAACP